MSDAREKLLAKIKALLAKTTENGCTEEEAMMALSKAQELMSSYEVTSDELREAQDEEAVLEKAVYKDLYGSRRWLAMAISRFTDTETFKTTGTKRYHTTLTFVGLRSDVDLAVWLLETLGAFVDREVRAFTARTQFRDANHRHHSVSAFNMGAVSRISKRMDALSTRTQEARTTNGNALVLIKTVLIKKKMEDFKIHQSRGTGPQMKGAADAFEEGQKAGDRASLGRPIAADGSPILQLGSKG